MQKKRYTKDQMYALIRKWEASGLPQTRFLGQHGIARSTFGYWRKKYMKETGKITRKDHFIPVKIDQAGFADTNLGRLELFYPNGIRLVCSLEMDLSRLKPLIVL